MPNRSLLLLLFLSVCVVPALGQDAEYLKRWTPGGDTNAYDLPYRHRYAPYEREGDTDWRDDRWQRTDKGPFLAHSILLPGYKLGPKLSAITAGPRKFLLYDQSAGSFVAGVTDGELRIDPARFGLLNHPQLVGHVSFYVPAKELWATVQQDGDRQIVKPLASAQIDYQGLYLHGDRVLLASRIDGVDVLEAVSPNTSSGVLTRELEVGAHSAEIRLTLTNAGRGLARDRRGRFAEWFNRSGKRQRATLDAVSQGVRIEAGQGRVVLCFPASEEPTYARISYVGASLPRPRGEVDPPPESMGLAALKEPGPKRWGDPLTTTGVVAGETDSALGVDRIGIPHDNPFGALFFLAGLAFFENGDAAVCTAHGDVWIVRGLDEQLQHVTWQRFATGLYQPLGLEIVDEKVYVLGRNQITRLHDHNDDGEADFYESFNHDLVIQGLPHAYAMRFDRAPDGSFLFLKSGEPPHGSALLRVGADGERLDVVARGFRHPFGLSVGPAGEITVADNEGNWVPSSKIDLIREGGFYGFLGNAAENGDSPPPERPLCYIPKVADNSSGGQFWNTSPSWLPFHRGEMFHFSWGRGTMHAVLRQSVAEIQQAATVQIPGVQFESGPAEAAFHPRDGQLYVVGLDGWQTGANSDGSFERVRHTGQPLRLPSRFSAHVDGIELEFTEPLDPPSAENPNSFLIEQWNYRWSSTYGSYHYSVKDPQQVGHDKVPVAKITVSPDGRRVFLHVAELQPVDQLHLAIDVSSSDGEPLKCDLYATINALAPSKEETKPGGEFDGNRAVSERLEALKPRNLPLLNP